MRLYTRTGDQGQTGLAGGSRVSKDDARAQALGAVDELNCALGLALAELDTTTDADLVRMLTAAQHLLFDVGAELASSRRPAAKTAPDTAGLVAEACQEVEAAIDRLGAELDPLRNFILPGGSRAAAALHLARAVCRRAEREVVALDRAEPVSPAILAFLNRLSDLLFVTARYANHRRGFPDVIWQKRA